MYFDVYADEFYVLLVMFQSYMYSSDVRKVPLAVAVLLCNEPYYRLPCIIK